MPRNLGSAVQVQKNTFFSYFAVRDNGGNVGEAHRMLRQVWNANVNGVNFAIQLQGTLPDGGVNVFAKKHLIVAAGGKYADRANGALEKAFHTLDKRMNTGPVHGGRGNKARAMAGTLVPRAAYGNSQDEIAKYQAKLADARSGLSKGYVTAAYGGTQPPGVCTVVLLDGMTQAQAALCFATAIAQSDDAWSFALTPERTINVDFPGNRVVTVRQNNTYETFRAIQVDVVYDDSVYHVYHAHGGVGPTGQDEYLGLTNLFD
jgi:hypothetical protein